jgi:hypothetical protein
MHFLADEVVNKKLQQAGKSRIDSRGVLSIPNVLYNLPIEFYLV